MPGPLRRSLASRPGLAAVPRAVRPTPPGRHRARGPGHPPGQPLLFRSPGAGACDLSLRTPPRHAEERCSLNRPTCPVTMTEGGDAGVRSATRPLWTAEPAGGAGPVEGPPRAEARGAGGGVAVPGVTARRPRRCQSRWAVPARGRGLAPHLPVSQEPRSLAAEARPGAGRKGPLPAPSASDTLPCAFAPPHTVPALSAVLPS